MWNELAYLRSLQHSSGIIIIIIKLSSSSYLNPFYSSFTQPFQGTNNAIVNLCILIIKYCKQVATAIFKKESHFFFFVCYTTLWIKFLAKPSCYTIQLREPQSSHRIVKCVALIWIGCDMK